MTCFICEKQPDVSENTGEHTGLNVPPQIKKMGYKVVESTELVFDGYRISPPLVYWVGGGGPQRRAFNR